MPPKRRESAIQPLALAFVNTLMRDQDHLRTLAAAESWVDEVSPHPPEGINDVHLSQSDLDELRLLRVEIGALFDHFESPPEPSAAHRSDPFRPVNRRLGRLNFIHQLEHSGGSTRVRTTPLSTLERVVSDVLDSLVQFADEVGLDTVRTCAASDCTLRFSDPLGRRMWCSPTACGNRERVRRHYRRRAHGEGESSRGGTSPT